MSGPDTDTRQPSHGLAGPSVFVSYRRSDSPVAARRIADALEARFGPENVFFDTRDLRPGTDWRREIEGRISSSDVVVALIGPQWVTIADERGRRKVLKPEEEYVVRTEIEAALRGGGRVVPVLVDDAALPSRDALPRPFRPITALHAMTLHDAGWDRDLESLTEALANPAPAVPQPTNAASRRNSNGYGGIDGMDTDPARRTRRPSDQSVHESGEVHVSVGARR